MRCRAWHHLRNKSIHRLLWKCPNSISITDKAITADEMLGSQFRKKVAPFTVTGQKLPYTEIWTERFQKKWSWKRGGLSSGWSFIRDSTVLQSARSAEAPHPVHITLQQHKVDQSAGKLQPQSQFRSSYSHRVRRQSYLFVDLPQVDVFLDGASRNQAEHLHVTPLTNPVGSTKDKK